MEADGGEWELSKENIQPLKHGRAMSSLQAALDPHCQEDLRQKRREFEEELRTSSGVTLLDVYHRYVLWVEQHHVTGGHGVNLKQLLEQAIMQFKTNRELYNDERYVGIWMRYALQSPEPLTLFKAMYEMQVGVQQAQFFATWAQHLEASGDTRGASRVLRKGIDLCAPPTCLLEGALRHLEARTSRQVALDVQQQQCQESAFVGGQQDARSVLAPLRPQGKQGTAPLIRTGRAARPAEQQPGGLAIVTTGSTAGNRGHTKVRVQADENAPPDALLVQPVAAPPFVTTAQLTKENSRAAGKWSGVTVKQHVPSASTQQSFDVLEEQGSQPAPCTPALVPGSRQALSERKKTAGFNEFSCWDSWEVPLFKPDPPDLLVRPMYDKASVYRGTTEFQFEEIRMANIRARQRQRLERQLELERDRRLQRELEQLMHQEREQSKQDAQVEALKREVQQLHEELEKLRSLLAKSRTGTREHAVMTSQVVHLERSILVAERSILGQPVLGGGLGDEEACGQPEEVDVPPGTPSVHQASGAASAENTQRGGALRTTDMSKVVRSLWNCTLAQSSLSTPSLSQQDRTLEAAPNKAEDEGPTETALDGVAVAVGATAAPFEVFREPTQTGVLPCIAQPAPVHVPMEGDNDENRPPMDCCQPEPSVRTRPLERRVPFAELPMQDDQAVGNNDDDDDVCQGIEPLEDEDNFTYAPSKSFVRKVTSTPCAVDYTVPAVGEGFTVGGLTALVQGVTIGDPCPSTPMTHLAPPCPAEHCPKPSQAQQQEPCHVEPQLLGHPALQPAAEPVPGPDAGNTVPLAKRRFSVAAAGDLSTILECSKEGKSSSNSGGSSCSSSSSQHLPGGATLSSLARPPTGGTSNLPVLQEEPDGHGDASTTTPAAPVPEQLQEQSDGNEQEAVPCGDPFSEELRCSILSSWQLQETNETQLFESTDKRPVLKADALITVGDHQMKVLHHLASGAYARVYLAEVADSEETYLDDDESFQIPSQMKVVLKADNSSTSACWEAYICCELRQRLKETLGTAPRCVVDLKQACFFSNGAILVFPYGPHGTLLDLVGQYKKQYRSCVPECLVLYFALELITTLEQVHSCSIIHADVKPDNILVIDLPSKAGFLDDFAEQGPSCLQLIDFGRGIDMTKFPPGTTFTHVVTTDGFVCTEMRENRPWTFQTDWFGLLGCLHVLLFGDYMDVEKLPNNTWGIRNKFKRYWQQDLWNGLFSTLLNIPSCSELPDLTPFKLEIQSLLRNKSRAHNVVLEALRAKNF